MESLTVVLRRLSIAALRAGDARRNMLRFQGDNLRRNLALVARLKELAAVESCTPAQLALAWVLSRGRYIVPIPGTSHRRRLEQNAAAAMLENSAETRTRRRRQHMAILSLHTERRKIEQV